MRHREKVRGRQSMITRNRRARGLIGPFRTLVYGCVAVVCVSVGIVLPLRWIDPPTTAFMFRDELLRDGPVRHRWVAWDGIAPELAVAVIASEDQKFFQHSGFDWDSIRSAIDERQAGGRLRGASTISQQLAKNLYLWPNQSWIRKGVEAYLTAWIELFLPKHRILEIYLNVAEFGDGVFGAGAAADHLIGTPPGNLTRRDAALLAAVLPNPKRLSASDPSDYVRRRTGEIMGVVEDLGGIAYLADPP